MAWPWVYYFEITNCLYRSDNREFLPVSSRQCHLSAGDRQSHNFGIWKPTVRYLRIQFWFTQFPPQKETARLCATRIIGSILSWSVISRMFITCGSLGPFYSFSSVEFLYALLKVRRKPNKLDHQDCLRQHILSANLSKVPGCHLRFHRIGIQSDGEEVDPLTIHGQLRLALLTFIPWRALIGCRQQ